MLPGLRKRAIKVSFDLFAAVPTTAAYQCLCRRLMIKTTSDATVEGQLAGHLGPASSDIRATWGAALWRGLVSGVDHNSKRRT